jgi:excisionase family DNA binding protein
MSDNLLTTEEVVDLLRVPRGTIFQFTHRREIPYYKIGRRNFFKLADIETFIESRRRPALDEK